MPWGLHWFSGKLWAISCGGEKEFLQNVFVTVYINVMTEEIVRSQSCLRQLLNLKLPIAKNDFFHSITAEHLEDGFPEIRNNLNHLMQTPYVEQHLFVQSHKNNNSFPFVSLDTIPQNSTSRGENIIQK